MSTYGATSSFVSGGSGSAQGGGEVDGVESPAALRANFGIMSLCFALNHGLSTTPLSLASSLLKSHLAYIGLCLFFCSALVGSLLVSAPLVSSLTPRRSLIGGMSLYCVYSFGFALSLHSSNTHWLQGPIWILASAAGGLGGSLLWTSQGAYFSSIADELAVASGQPREAVTAKLSGSFSFALLSLEVLAKLSFSGLQALSLSEKWIATLYFVLAAAAVIIFISTHPPVCVAKVDGQSSLAASAWNNLQSTASLWSDPVIWLLSPTNLAFGCSAAFMNGTVNADMTAHELGKQYVTVFAAVSVIIAAIAAPLMSMLSASSGKELPIACGAGCFLAIPVIIISLGCCDGWRWGILWLYLAQGVGRAVFESTNRAAFSDFFPGQASGAFATSAFQTNIGFAVTFFLQFTWPAQHVAWLLAVLAMAMPFSYFIAAAMRARACGAAEAEGSKPIVSPRSKV